MKRPIAIFEVWKEVTLKDGEIIYKYIDTFNDPISALELCQLNNCYFIKKLGGDNGRREGL